MAKLYIDIENKQTVLPSNAAPQAKSAGTPYVNQFFRLGTFPLDRSSIFDTLEDAKKYAAGGSDGSDSRGLYGTAYAGQQISVVETEYNEDGTTVKNVNVQAYIVAGEEQADGTWLIPVSQGENMSDIEITVWEDWPEEQQ